MSAGVVGVAADRSRLALPADLCALLPLSALLLSVQLLLRPHQLPLLLLPLQAQGVHCGQDRLDNRIIIHHTKSEIFNNYLTSQFLFFNYIVISSNIDDKELSDLR